VLGVSVAALAAAGSGYWVLGGESEAQTTTAGGPSATAQVARGTLAADEAWAATLGHGSPQTVAAHVQGTVTRLVEQGVTVGRGSELYRIDERPVTLMYGTVPMYRDLRVGDTGVDVAQLEANLSELGYTGFTPDDEFTWSTESAVTRWQEDIGTEATGTVSASSIEFLPAGGRVDTVAARVGDVAAPNAPILDITGTDQVANFEADVADRPLLAVGAAVTVVLPDGNAATGTVMSSSVVAATTGGAAGTATEPAGAEESVLTVEVTLSEPVDDGFVGAPVDVVVPVDERIDVLHVPVNALLALAEGGYGLEVVAEDGTTSVVPVDTGLFADGRVEVSGAGIGEGTTVGVAGR
jgi:peptidoglycan hydrolase-like protein with peptidoglycan-binding domain